MFFSYFIQEPIYLVMFRLESELHATKQTIQRIVIWFVISLSLSRIFIGPCLITRMSSSSMVILSLLLSYLALTLSLFCFIPMFKSIYLFTFCIIMTGASLGPLWTHCLYIASKLIFQEGYYHHAGVIFGVLSTTQYLGAYFCDKVFTYVSDYYQWKYYLVLLFPLVLITAVLNITTSKQCWTAGTIVNFEDYYKKEDLPNCKEICINILNYMLNTHVILSSILICGTKLLSDLVIQEYPKYLHETLSSVPTNISNLLSIFFKFGCVTGVILIGTYIDKSAPKQYLIINAKLVSMLGILFIPMFLSSNFIVLKIIVFLFGVILSGSESIMSSLIPIRLAEHYETSILIMFSICNGYPMLLKMLFSSFLDIGMVELTNVATVEMRFVLVFFMILLLALSAGQYMKLKCRRIEHCTLKR